MGTAREKLLLMAENDDLSGFQNILEDQKSKRPSIDIAEIITELDQKQSLAIWQKMKDIAEKLIQDIGTASYNDSVATANQFKLLQCLTSVLLSVVKSDVYYVENILPLCRTLHGALKILESKDTKLCNQLYRLFELWWTKQLDGREEFVRQTFFYLIEESLQKSSKIAVKRVYSMKECLEKLPLNNVDIGLLIQCVTSPACLRVDEGRKFIAFVMLLSRKILKKAHSEIKLKLTQCDSSDLNYYGEIYAKIWSSANNDLKQSVELDCIQDLMHHCIHASSNGLASSFLNVLSHLHNQKRHHEVGKMLVRLYRPILWRALKVVNSSVRYNAAMILFNAFPLEDPDMNRVELDEEIQKQLDQIEVLLYDPSPSVRCVAVMGVCHICSVYWEMIPISVVRSLLANLVENLAFDAASAKVRLHVFKGFIVLLDNPLSHSLLNEFLPKVGKCFQDTSESVRRIFVDMLLSIKSFQTLKYWKITPPDELLRHLAEDKPPVARRITSLLFNTYHPLNKGDELLLERSISLILGNRHAARRFYCYAYKYMDLNNSVHYILLVNKLLLGNLNLKLEEESVENDSNELENSNSKQDTDETLDADKICGLSMEVIGGLIDAICIVWRSIKLDLDKDHNKRIKKHLHLEIARALPILFRCFKNTEAFDSILYLSSFLPASLVQMQRSFCMSRLRSGEASPNVYFDTLLECMCNWGHVDDVFDIISNRLRLDASPVTKSSSKTKKTCKQSVTFQEPQKVKPELALEYLRYIIQTPICSNVAVNYRRSEAIDLLMELRKIEEILISRLSSDGKQSQFGTDEYLCSTFIRMCEVAILLHNNEAQPPLNAFDILSNTMELIKLHVIPKIREIRVDKRKVRKLASTTIKRSLSILGEDELPKKIIESFLHVLWNALAVSTVDKKFLYSVADFFKALFVSGIRCLIEDGDRLLKAVLCCFHQLQENCVANEIVKSDFFNSELLKLFQHWLKCGSQFGNAFTNSFQEKFSPFKKPLLNVLKTYQKCDALGSKCFDDVMKSVTIAVFTNVSEFIRSVLQKDESISEQLELRTLPDFSTLVLSTVISSPDLTKIFMEKLVTCMKFGEITDCIGFIAILTIFSALVQKYRFTGSVIKEGVLLLDDLVHKALDGVQSSNGKESPKLLQEVTSGLENLKKECGYAV